MTAARNENNEINMGRNKRIIKNTSKYRKINRTYRVLKTVFQICGDIDVPQSKIIPNFAAVIKQFTKLITL